MLWISETACVVVKSCFKRAFGKSDVVFLFPTFVSFNCGLVNNACNLAFPRERTVFFSVAITLFSCGWAVMGFFVKDGFVVC